MQEKRKRIRSIIHIFIMIAIVIVAYRFYQKYNFNPFTKAEYNLGISKFERDSAITCTHSDSYKIMNTDYNDAMFYETIEVLPNTPYKVTCKIKTEEVQSKQKDTDSGAHICISGSLEKSDNVVGTSDWTTITFYFNSKNRTQVDVGFRLGGYEDYCMRNSMVFRF